MKLCAGRVAQQLNLTSLATECGIDVRTVQNWMSVLQSSFVLFYLQPHHTNFNKRIVKTPKLYFYDTELACSLLGIKSVKELAHSHFRGPLFENYVITECLKNKYNTGSRTNYFYWRDNKAVEVDLLAENGRKMLPIEIKSAQNYRPEYVSNLQKWNDYAGQTGGILLFDGDQHFKQSNQVSVLNWREAHTLKRLY